MAKKKAPPRSGAGAQDIRTMMNRDRPPSLRLRGKQAVGDDTENSQADDFEPSKKPKLAPARAARQPSECEYPQPVPTGWYVTERVRTSGVSDYTFHGPVGASARSYEEMCRVAKFDPTCVAAGKAKATSSPASGKLSPSRLPAITTARPSSSQRSAPTKAAGARSQPSQSGSQPTGAMGAREREQTRRAHALTGASASDESDDDAEQTASAHCKARAAELHAARASYRAAQKRYRDGVPGGIEYWAERHGSDSAQAVAVRTPLDQAAAIESAVRSAHLEIASVPKADRLWERKLLVELDAGWINKYAAFLDEYSPALRQAARHLHEWAQIARTDEERLFAPRQPHIGTGIDTGASAEAEADMAGADGSGGGAEAGRADAEADGAKPMAAPVHSVEPCGTQPPAEQAAASALAAQLRVAQAQAAAAFAGTDEDASELHSGRACDVDSGDEPMPLCGAPLPAPPETTVGEAGGAAAAAGAHASAEALERQPRCVHVDAQPALAGHQPAQQQQPSFTAAAAVPIATAALATGCSGDDDDDDDDDVPISQRMLAKELRPPVPDRAACAAETAAAVGPRRAVEACATGSSVLGAPLARPAVDGASSPSCAHNVHDAPADLNEPCTSPRGASSDSARRTQPLDVATAQRPSHGGATGKVSAASARARAASGGASGPRLPAFVPFTGYSSLGRDGVATRH